MKPAIKTLLESVRKKDWHSATETYAGIMQEKVNARLSNVREHLSEDYNGWKNYETWNVALWIQNDQFLYDYAREYAKAGYKAFARDLMTDKFTKKTKDGVRWDDPKLDIKALDDMMKELDESHKPKGKVIKEGKSLADLTDKDGGLKSCCKLALKHGGHKCPICMKDLSSYSYSGAVDEGKTGKCVKCGRKGLSLDDEGLCHECWQDRKDSEKDLDEGKTNKDKPYTGSKFGKDKLKEDEDDEDEPGEDDDIFCDDSGGPFYYNRKKIANNVKELKQWMKREKYYPNVWRTSDHGNRELVTELDEATLREDRMRVRCMECDKVFMTGSPDPKCPKCGGHDVEPE